MVMMNHEIALRRIHTDQARELHSMRPELEALQRDYASTRDRQVMETTVMTVGIVAMEAMVRPVTELEFRGRRVPRKS